MSTNGQLADAELGRLSDGNRIRVDLVPQTNTMIAAAAHDGVTLRATQGYRTLAEQVQIFLARYTPQALGLGPFGDARWWNGRRYVRTSGASAAPPGTSNHGLGQAVDWDMSQPGALAWLTAHGASYGWARPAWTFQSPTVEPWHWEAVLVPMSGGATSTSTTTDQEDIMATIDDLRTVLTEVIRSEGVSGAGDLGRLTDALDAPTRRIVSEETTKVLRSEGVSGAGDVGRLAAALHAAGITSVTGTTPTAKELADELAKRLVD